MTATTMITVRGDFSSEMLCSAGIMIPATPPLDSLFALRPLSYCTCSADVNHGPHRKPGASFRINQVSDDCWLRARIATATNSSCGSQQLRQHYTVNSGGRAIFSSNSKATSAQFGLVE